MNKICIWKLLNLIWFHLFFIFSLALENRSKKYCCDLFQWVFCLCFSLSFIAFSLKFWSFIRCEFILYMVLENVLISFFYIQLSNLPSTTCWRICLIFIVYSCLLCHRLGDHKRVCLSLDFLSYSIDLCICFVPIPYCFDCCSTVI